MPNDPENTCPECGAGLPAGTAAGQCPNCLFGLGLAAAKAEVNDRPSEEGGQKPEVSGQTFESDQYGDQREVASQFGDYELLEEIGRGGMGLVYKARQKSLDRIVALKLLLFGPRALPEAVKRFRAEAVATAALQHPNIVAIHEVGVHQGQHFLVMDFVEGPSLAKVISDFRFQISDTRRAARYVKIIAEAIHYAHGHGLLHRDLKPSNVLIDAQDQPRVTDFGLAKRLEGDSELTVTGQVLGSPNYMPPEQATGKRGTVSRRSDVYALGAILYHTLTGRPPFVAEGLAETVQQVLNAEPISPRALNPKLPIDLETVCLKCLEKEPAKRYATAQMVAEELGRFLEGKPVLARPVGRLAKGWRWCRRNPRLALATGAAVVSLFLGVAGVTWQWRSATLHARRETRERQRAEAEALLARRNAYAADMNLVQGALEDNNLGSALELLNRHRPQKESQISNLKSQIETDLRGWEWRYFWARCRSDERWPNRRCTKAASALAYSTDGKWLAVRQEGGAVALWDAVTKQSVTNLSGAGLPRALAFAPGTNLLAYGDTDATGQAMVSLWDLSVLKEIARLPHSHRVLSIAFSPDAEEMAALAFDGLVKVWEFKSKRVPADFPTPRDNGFRGHYSVVTNAQAPEPMQSPANEDYGCVLYSPNGHWLVVGEAKPRIRLLDRTASIETDIATPGDGITALAFSPDSQRLATGCGYEDKTVYVWDVAARTNLPLTGHITWVSGLAFSRDGQTLASASDDKTLRLWDLAGKAEPRRFQGNTDRIRALAWSPDGRDLVTGAQDGSVRFWDPDARPTPARAVLPISIWSWGLVFLPDSKTFLTVNKTNGEVVLWDTANLHMREPLAFLGTNHSSLDLSSDGRWLGLAATNGNIQVWDFRARRQVASLVFPESWAFAVVFSPHARYFHCGALVSGGVDTKIWSCPDWREVNFQDINHANLWDVDFSADERTVAIGHSDGTAAWWDIVTGKRLAQFRRQDVDHNRVRFSRDGRLFAIAGMHRGRITLRNTATGQDIPLGRNYRGELVDLVFSPDGRRLITSGYNPKSHLKVWDVETGRDVATLPCESTGYFHHIGFSPDSNTLFADSMNGIALLWRAPSLDEIEATEQKEGVP